MLFKLGLRKQLVRRLKTGSTLDNALRLIGHSRPFSTVDQRHPGVSVVHNAVTGDEARTLLTDIDRRLGRKRYLASHFDLVIHDYKESEMPTEMWSPASRAIIDRLFQLGFELGGVENSAPRLAPHVIDLKAATGEIFPHVDSIKHGGKIVAALSLLSERTMRLTSPPENFVVGAKLDVGDAPGSIEVTLPPLSFYVLFGSARYDLAHDISKGPERRVSVVFRDQPADWAKP